MTPTEIQKHAAVKVASHYNAPIALAARAVLDGEASRYLCLAVCELATCIGSGDLNALMLAEQDVKNLMGYR